MADHRARRALSEWALTDVEVELSTVEHLAVEDGPSNRSTTAPGSRHENRRLAIARSPRTWSTESACCGSSLVRQPDGELDARRSVCGDIRSVSTGRRPACRSRRWSCTSSVRQIQESPCRTGGPIRDRTNYGFLRQYPSSGEGLKPFGIRRTTVWFPMHNDGLPPDFIDEAGKDARLSNSGRGGGGSRTRRASATGSRT